MKILHEIHQIKLLTLLKLRVEGVLVLLAEFIDESLVRCVIDVFEHRLLRVLEECLLVHILLMIQSFFSVALVRMEELENGLLEC